MNPVEGVALLSAGTVALGSLRVILSGARPERQPVPQTRAIVPVISGPCPSCGGTITLLASARHPDGARWTEPCDDCGMRLVGVPDPAQSGPELVWFPVQAQPTG